MSGQDIPFDATPYPQPNEALEFLIPMEQPSMYREKSRKAFEARVTAGVRRALVEFREGQDVSHEAITKAAGTVLAFLDGMGS